MSRAKYSSIFLERDALQTFGDAGDQRYPWLDAVRGLAAFIVVLSHTAAFVMFDNKELWATAQLPPFGLLFSGHQAVIVFFVLSGFALYLMCERASLTAGTFLKARFVRIYLPYLAALIIASATLKIPFWSGVEWPRLETGLVPRGSFSLSAFVNHVFLIGHFSPKLINPPIWSLVYEMRLSIVFPFIFWIVARTSAATLIGPILFSCALSAALYFPTLNKTIVDDGKLLDSLRTIHFAGMFFIGAYVAKYRTQIVLWAIHRSRGVLWAFGATAVGVYFYSFGYSWPQWPRYIGELFTAAAAAGFISLAVASPIAVPAPLRRLGRISFSLFLIHYPVMHIVEIYGHGRLNGWTLWIVAVSGSLISADLFLRFVERPSHSMSKRIQKENQPLKAASLVEDFPGAAAS